MGPLQRCNVRTYSARAINGSTIASALPVHSEPSSTARVMLTLGLILIFGTLPMTDPGLNSRLNQRSRRSGLMVGITMALTLMVCVGAFTAIFTQLEPLVADFVGQDAEPTSEPVVAVAQPTEPPPNDGTNPNDPGTPAPEETAEPEATEEPTTSPAEEPTAPATPDDEEFVPDYQLDATGPVNLRAGPSVNNADVVIAIPVDAPLMFLDQTAVTEDPAGDLLNEGGIWMRFRTEDGEEGWLREVDVTEYEP